MQELSKNDVMNYTLFKFHMDGDLNNPKSLLQFVLQEFEKVDMIAKDKFGAKIGSITFYGRGGYGNNCSFPINISEIMEKEICNNERLSLTKDELDDLYKSFGGKFYSGDLSITNISFGNIVPKEKCFMIEPQTEYLLLNYYSNFKESNDMLDYNRRYGGCNDYIAKPKAQIILKRDEEVVFSFDKHPEWMNEVANILNLTSRATNTASQIYRIPNKYANIMHRCTRIPITEKEYNSYYKSFGNNFYSGDFSYLEVTRLELEKSLEIIEIVQ